MAVNCCEECLNVCSVVDLSDGGIIDQQYDPSSNINHSVVPKVLQSWIFVNSEPGLDKHTNLEVDKVNDYAPCAMDVNIDIEKGMSENLNSNDEVAANFKCDIPSPKEVQRDTCLHIGGKFMQLMINNGIELPKFTSRGSIRSRKYKRSQSFNSRRVVLLFSVLSSVGTIILIYLTLRMRLISNGSGNV